MKRFDCLKALAAVTREDDLVVTNLGNTMHEWLTVRPSRANLYNMNLGQCTPVALGLALALPHRRVIALDGDGNLLLNLVSLADVSHRKPANLKIFVFDNEAYESPGGMPSATAHGVDLVQIAKGCGIEKSFAAANARRISAEAGANQRKPAPVRQRENRDGQHRAPPLRQRSISSSTSISSPPTSKRPKKSRCCACARARRLQRSDSGRSRLNAAKE